MKHITTCLALCLLTAQAAAQEGGFSTQKLISNAADRPKDVYAADLDGDGDLDVVSASASDDTVAWYENLGGGSIGPAQIVASDVDGAQSVYGGDLDGDGDEDLVSAGSSSNQIAWHENLGGGAFGPTQVLSTSGEFPADVFVVDLNGDGDVDVLAASLVDNKVAWYKNFGNGLFSGERVITTQAAAVVTVHAADLDGDGDADVLSGSFSDDKIAWYENLGNETFGPQQVISTDSTFPTSVFGADLDGDGDNDVLSASRDDAKVTWHRNLGGGSFAPGIEINDPFGIAGSRSAIPVDFDLDGDLDVVAIGSAAFNQVGWFENLGGGTFSSYLGIEPGNSQVIVGGRTLFAADLDQDGDPDLLTVAESNDNLSWYENQIPTAQTYGIGCGASVLDFQPTSVARIANSVTGRIDGVLDLTFVALGLSNSDSALGALPQDLAAFGLPGCDLYQSLDLFGLPTQSSAKAGAVDWSFPLPGEAALLGLHFYGQSYSLGVSAGTLEIGTSNGVDWQIGL